MSSLGLPVFVDGSLSSYLEKIKRFPVLSEEEECRLIKSYKLENDIKSAHVVITSHLRLVAKIAMGFKGYGLPMADLIAEGNIGLMQALKKFDCKKGFRFSTYAIWWVRASIQEYVLRSWSIVKMGTSATQKKLFYNLRKIKNKILSGQGRNNLLEADVQTISEDLNVTTQEVTNMNNRFSGNDKSLESNYGKEDSDAKLIDYLEDASQNIEEQMLQNNESSYRQKIFAQVLKNLNSRELDILKQRHLSENPSTLEDLSQQYNISRERVRQIEAKTLEKVKHFASLKQK